MRFQLSPLRTTVVLCATLALAIPTAISAQPHRSIPPAGAKTHVVVPGGRYEAAGIRRWFFGGGYRDIWTTPVEVLVLDLERAKGGLTPEETGGYGQTTTLEFVGEDGLEYAVRSVDKEPTRRLDPLLRGTVVASIIQDQTSGFLPTAGVVVDPLLEASGILHPKHELVVIPDDPKLGEFREDFAGLIGVFVDRPQEREGGEPGFADSKRISGTDTFLEEIEEGACVRAETREYLKARLIDLLVGDRDRHEGQWRWAEYPDGPGCTVWRPIPEDRDQAFIYNDGVMMWVYRRVEPRMVRFDEEYPEVYGLTFNGWEVDRQLLSEFEESEWLDVAEDLQGEITDEVIENAVRRLPEAHYRLRGPWIERSLKARRDALPEVALAYYVMIADAVEVVGTDRDEEAIFEHHPGGALTLTLTYSEGPRSDAPYFQRTFRPHSTSEVRLFLKGGDDQVEVRGAKGEIIVRAVGGGGDDVFSNQSAAPGERTRFYDDRGDNRFDGSAKIDESAFERPPSTNLIHRYALDWGGIERVLPFLTYSPDVGARFGMLYGADRYGFRKVPWQSRHVGQVGVTSIGPEVLLGWDSRFRNAFGSADVLVHLEYSGLDVLRFHGFGNDTEIGEDTDFFKVHQQELTIAPALEWTFGFEAEEGENAVSRFRPKLRVGVGPILQRSATSSEDNADRFIGTLDPAPLGSGKFGQVGARGWIEVDTRDNAGYPTRGFHIALGGSVFPAAWDVEEAFGQIQGVASGVFTPGANVRWPTLALRAGGKKVFGPFPFHEAAYVGGTDNVRGLREERFAGDGSMFGNAELRIPLAEVNLLLPADFGIMGAVDAGRVFYDGDPDDADKWHTTFGGGVWLSLMDRIQTVGLTVMKGDDLTAVYLSAGLHF